MTTCALCGLAFAPGGGDCARRGCPLAGAGCTVQDCPRCGYAVPDEGRSRLATLVRRFLSRADPRAASTLADLEPGDTAVVEAIEGSDALAARLTAQGIAPGVELHLVQRIPSFVVEMETATVALERRVAVAVRLAAVPMRLEP